MHEGKRLFVNTAGAFAIVLTVLASGCGTAVDARSNESPKAASADSPTPEQSPDPTRPVILVPTLQRIGLNGRPVNARPTLGMASIENTKIANDSPYATPLPLEEAQSTATAAAVIKTVSALKFGPTTTGLTARPTPSRHQ